MVYSSYKIYNNLIGKTLEELMSWGVDDTKIRETINKLLITKNRPNDKEGYLFH